MSSNLTIAQQIGIANAEEAFDQQHEYACLENAVDSYFGNMKDTLIEQRILTDETFAAALRAFDARVAALRNS